MRLSLIVALVGALFLPRSARCAEGPNPGLEEAKALYFELQYERCLQRLAQARSAKSSRRELAEIELYAGLCTFGERRAEREAEHHFALARGLAPDIELPRFTSPKLKALFEGAGTRVTPAQEAPVAPPSLPDAPLAGPSGAPPPTIGTVSPGPVPSLAPSPTPASARLRPLPLGLGGAALAALGTGVFFGVRAQALEGDSRSLRFESDARDAAQGARRSATLANVSYGVAGTAALFAVVLQVLQSEAKTP